MAGDTERVVIAVKHGSVTDPQVRASFDPMLARLSQLPDVAGVMREISDVRAEHEARLRYKAELEEQ